MAVMKTPGVYIVEKNAFPNSVVEVATAVPAFIGYTAIAVNGGTSLHRKPMRISSMAEYERYFGGPPKPAFSLLRVGDDGDGGPVAVPPPPGLEDAPGQAVDFKLGGKQYVVSRLAGKEGGRFLMYQAMRHFFQNGGGTCYIVSVGDYDATIDAGDEKSGLVGGITPLLKEQEPTMVLTPDAVLLPRAECAIVQAAVLKHCGLDMQNRFAILDVWGGEHDGSYEKGDCIELFRNDIGINYLKWSAAYYPWLHTSLVQGGDVNQTAIGNVDNLVRLVSEELNLPAATPAAGTAPAPTPAPAPSTGTAAPAPPKKRTKADDQRALLDDVAKDKAAWKAQLIAEIDATGKPQEDKDEAKARLEDADTLEATIAVRRRLVHEALLIASPLYKKSMEELRRLLNLMPPSAAMAGLYTMVDNTRGVWKAPANISVAGVIQPAVEISHGDQETLNVHTAGKSINAIRSFIGEGALVWGARTLDGNSLDWRYINVRRTMIMLEESCRLAAKAMVFEPNVGNTWVTIKSMISNFLTGIWKRGGLAGAVPDDAFSVHVGLGETMTPEDILEGILRVTVLVAISRPAEFIEITFQQQMQKS